MKASTDAQKFAHMSIEVGLSGFTRGDPLPRASSAHPPGRESRYRRDLPEPVVLAAYAVMMSVYGPLRTVCRPFPDLLQTFSRPIVEVMCRNITELRGLEPEATAEEIAAAARQYVRKVSGLAKPSGVNADAFELAVAEVTASTERLLAGLAPRRQPPKSIPPLRRPDVRARLGLQ